MAKHIKIKRAKINRSRFGNAVVFTLVIFFGLFMALPFVYTVGNAFKPLNELWIFPPRLMPVVPTLENFKSMWSLLQNTAEVPMTRYFFNTLFITVVGTAGQVFVCSLCAYPLAKDNFPGSKLLFKVIFFSLMFNGAVTGVPTYMIMAKLNWIDSYNALIMPVIGSAFGLYLIKQFMEQLNDSILESARIDGANEFVIYWKIVMPLVKPAWLTLIVFSVQGLWNSGTSIYIYQEEFKTFSYAISQIVSAGISRAGAAAAASVIMMLVPIAVYIITQSNIMDTMANSGIKE